MLPLGGTLYSFKATVTPRPAQRENVFVIKQSDNPGRISVV